MKTRSPLFLLAALAMAAPAFAAASLKETTPPTQRIHCKVDNTDFFIILHSKSGDVTEDDMTLDIEQGAQTHRVDLPVSWFKAIPAKSNSPSVCEGVPAFRVKDHTVLVLIGIDNRPSTDETGVFLYHLDSQQPGYAKYQIGELLSQPDPPVYEIKTIDSGIKVRLMRDYIDTTHNDSPQNQVPGWLTMKVRGGKILLTGWE